MVHICTGVCISVFFSLTFFYKFDSVDLSLLSSRSAYPGGHVDDRACFIEHRHLITALVKSTSHQPTSSADEINASPLCAVRSTSFARSLAQLPHPSGSGVPVGLLYLSLSLSLRLSLTATGNPGFRYSGGIHAQPSVVTPRIHESMDPPLLSVRSLRSAADPSVASHRIRFRWCFRQHDDATNNLLESNQTSQNRAQNVI